MLKLNCTKSKEIIITARDKRDKSVQPPPPCPNIERVSSLRALGVILNDKLTAAGHVDNLLSASTGLMYALWVLRSHGIPPASLYDVFRATVVSKITYCSPAWSGIVFSGGSCTSGLVSELLQATWLLQQGPTVSD